jgi:hypothetical protein
MMSNELLGGPRTSKIPCDMNYYTPNSPQDAKTITKVGIVKEIILIIILVLQEIRSFLRIFYLCLLFVVPFIVCLNIVSLLYL